MSETIPPYPGYIEPVACTDRCFAMPYCEVCGLRKKPRGRDAAAAMANSLCDEDCDGYRREPTSGHRWPEEKD